MEKFKLKQIVAACLLGLSMSQSPSALSNSVIAAGDEWLFSDWAFSAEPDQTSRLALGIAELLAGTDGGDILVVDNSTYHSISGASFSNNLASAGFNVIVDLYHPLDPASLAPFDAVIFAGAGAGDANSNNLIDYVSAGGSVMVLGGTGKFGTAPWIESAWWHPFLSEFGLNLSTFGGWMFTRDGLIVPRYTGGSSLLPDVDSFFYGFGQAVFLTDITNPLTEMLLLGHAPEFGLFSFAAIAFVPSFEDDFSRVTDIGLSNQWTFNNVTYALNFSTDGTQGLVDIATGASNQLAIADTDPVPNAVVTTTINWVDLPPSQTAYDYAGPVIRISPDSKSFYQLRLRENSDKLNATLQKTVNGSGTVLMQKQLSIPLVQGVNYRIRLVATESNPTIIKAKIWQADEAEPATWTISTEDSDPALQNAGNVGMRFGANSGFVGPSVIGFDDFQVVTCDLTSKICGN